MDNWQDQHLADITQIMREADEMFQKTGGSTRHYLRDVFFPMLEHKGYCIKKADAIGEIETLKAENSKMRNALEEVIAYRFDPDKVTRIATEALKTT